MIYIDKFYHRNDWRIKLSFTFNEVYIEGIKTLETARYSKTYKSWYIDYDKKAFHEFKLLGLPFKINAIANSGTNSSVYEKIEDTGIEKNHSPFIDSDIHSNDSDNNVRSTSERPQKIRFSNGNFYITINYTAADSAFLKSLKGSYWNSKYANWCVKATLENLEALQERFSYYREADYLKTKQLVLATSDPEVIELYLTPEHPDCVAIKVRGWRVDFSILKSITDRSYDKPFKRWLIPYKAAIIQRIIEYYNGKGATIINRIPDTNKSYGKDHKNYHEKQTYLLTKFDLVLQPLIKEYSDVLISQRYSWSTIKSYCGSFAKFLFYLSGRPPSDVDHHVVNKYIRFLSGRKVSDSLIHNTINAIKFYYQKVLFLPDFEIDRIKRPRTRHTLPTILSIGEVDRMFRSVTNLKHLTLLYSIYSSGLRLNEVLNLRVQDILWDRNQICIKCAKGKKDRMVMLSGILKEVLKTYFDQYQPIHWLFEGQDRKTNYSRRSVANIVKKAAMKAGISRRVTPHTLRHCFATHLLDRGTDVRYIQELLGHKDIKTTLIYTHVTTRSMESIKSPLDQFHSHDNFVKNWKV